jgi:hypothetical protein
MAVAMIAVVPAGIAVVAIAVAIAMAVALRRGEDHSAACEQGGRNDK